MKYMCICDDISLNGTTILCYVILYFALFLVNATRGKHKKKQHIKLPFYN